MPTPTSNIRPHYAPFGSSLNTRSFSAGSGFRFGFNGKEKQGELSDDDYDYGARIFDVRLGRWFSVDQLSRKYSAFAPYCYCVNNPIIFVDPDGKVVIVKDVASFKAILGTLTADEIDKISINKDGSISIIDRKNGSSNLQNLSLLVNSKTKHIVITSNSYNSANGIETLPNNVFGRTLFPDSENDVGLKKNLVSPDNNVYIILKPNTEEGIVPVFAHEAYGHAVLGQKKRIGEKVNPFHKIGPTGEQNNDLKKQGWPAVALAKKNYADNIKNKDWKNKLNKKVRDFNKTTKL